MHNDDNRWQTIFIEYFLYVYGNRQAVDGHAGKPELGCERVAITRNCAILNSFAKGLTESILNSFLQLFLQNCDSLTPDSFGKGAY